MPIQFTTDDSPGYRRLALWQDIVCDVFVGLDCKSVLGSAFHGSVTQASLGKAICSDVCSDQQRVFRTPSRIARSDQDFVLIALGNRGVGGVVQDGRETVIHPGEFALYDTTRPYELQFNDAFTQTIFKVPREMLQRRIGGTEALTAVSFGPDSALQKLAYDFIYRLCQNADQIAQRHAVALSEQAVAALLDPSLGAALSAESAHSRASLRARSLAIGDGGRARYLAALCQRSSRGRTDLVPALRALRAPGAMQARSRLADARAPPCRRNRLRLGL